MTNFKLMICVAASAALQACAFVPHVSLHLNAARVMSSRSQPQPVVPLRVPRFGFIASGVRGSKVSMMAGLQKGLDGAMSGTVTQIGKLCTAAPSVITLVALNTATKRLFKHFGLEILPPPLVGMFIIFFGLLCLRDADAARVVGFFKPGVDLVTRFLPMFYVPAIVVLPLSASAFAAADMVKALGVIVCAQIASYTVAALVTTGLQTLTPQMADVKDQSAPLPALSMAALKLLAAATAAAFAAAVAAPAHALQPFMLLATAAGFVTGSRLPALLPAAVNKVLHPLMLSAVVISGLLAGYGAASATAYDALLRAYLVLPGGPASGWAAGNEIMYMLGPAIWSFGFGLYARRRLLAANLVPILGGSVASAAAGVLSGAVLAGLLNPGPALKLALLPRATAALAVVQAGMIGASASLVTASCVVTGMLGANFGLTLLAFLRIRSPCARGVAVGGGGITLGVAALAKDDPDAFPYGALGMALMSTWATIFFALPPIRSSILHLAGLPSVDPPAILVSLLAFVVSSLSSFFAVVFPRGG